MGTKEHVRNECEIINETFSCNIIIIAYLISYLQFNILL